MNWKIYIRPMQVITGKLINNRNKKMYKNVNLMPN